MSNTETAAGLDEEPREIELKFLLAPEDLDRIAAHPAVTSRCTLPAKADPMETAYYDTPELDLNGRNVMLRVRRERGSAVQTVKVDVAEARTSLAQTRYEWSWPVKDGLDAAVLEKRAVARHIPAAVRRRLVPVFSAAIGRREAEVDLGTTKAMLALDLGVMRAGGQELPVVELELELVSGPVQPLFDFAIELAGIAPLTIGTESKAGFGHRLLTGRPLKAVVRELPDGTGIEALRAAMAMALENHAAALDRADPTAVAQICVALRRAAACPAAAALSERAKALADSLSGKTPYAVIRAIGSSRYTKFMLRLSALAEASPAAASKAPAFDLDAVEKAASDLIAAGAADEAAQTAGKKLTLDLPAAIDAFDVAVTPDVVMAMAQELRVLRGVKAPKKTR